MRFKVPAVTVSVPRLSARIRIEGPGFWAGLLRVLVKTYDAVIVGLATIAGAMVAAGFSLRSCGM